MKEKKDTELGQDLAELLTSKNDPAEVREALNLMLDLATDPFIHKQDPGYLTVEFMAGIDLLRRIVQTIETHRS